MPIGTTANRRYVSTRLSRLHLRGSKLWIVPASTSGRLRGSWRTRAWPSSLPLMRRCSAASTPKRGPWLRDEVGVELPPPDIAHQVDPHLHGHRGPGGMVESRPGHQPEAAFDRLSPDDQV